jgi:glutathione S-transferase
LQVTPLEDRFFLAQVHTRALVRLQTDYISRTNIVPAFYRFLQAQDPERQMVYKEEFSAALEHLASPRTWGAPTT